MCIVERLNDVDASVCVFFFFSTLCFYSPGQFFRYGKGNIWQQDTRCLSFMCEDTIIHVGKGNMWQQDARYKMFVTFNTERYSLLFSKYVKITSPLFGVEPVTNRYTAGAQWVCYGHSHAQLCNQDYEEKKNGTTACGDVLHEHRGVCFSNDCFSSPTFAPLGKKKKG